MRRVAWIVLLLCGALPLLAADITGTWSADVTLDAGSGVATFTFKQTGESLAGTYSGTLGQAKVTGTLKGNQVEWSFDSDQAGKVVYRGTLEGNQITGTCEYGAVGKGTFKAQKK